jgi:hypothetical protein
MELAFAGLHQLLVGQPLMQVLGVDRWHSRVPCAGDDLDRRLDLGQRVAEDPKLRRVRAHVAHRLDEAVALVTNNGYEYNLVMVAAVFALAGTGPGDWSLDNALGIDLAGTRWALAALGAGMLGGIGAVLSGRLTAERGAHPDAA